MPSFSWIGESVRRLDGVARVRGSLVFPTDIRAEGMLHCRPVLAPHPHARLLGVRTAAALEVPGVLRVLTHEDVPGSKRYGYQSDHPVLCDDKVRHLGDMVAVVIAETDEAAAAGARLVEIDYEPLPVVTDPEAALRAGAPRVHDQGNILHQVHYLSGDPAAAFARPDVLVVEQTYRMQRMDHVFLETEGGVAFPEDGGVRIVVGGQDAYYHQRETARCLGLPVERVRVIETTCGGAFGGKGDITIQIVAGLGALLTGRPCRMAWTREEHFLAGVKRHPYVIRVRTAATRDGDLLALEAQIYSDTGAYAVFGDSILEVSVENIAGLYRIPNVKIDAWAVYTNNLVSGAFRGFGAAQACLAIESQMSQLARRLGMDEIAFRLRNLLRQGERTAVGHELALPHGARQALEAAAAHPLWRERGRLDRAEGAIRRGVGVAMGVKGYGLGIGDMPDWGTADLTLTPEGRYRLGIGIVDIGQGSFTALVQMAAETLACEPQRFDVHAGDTGVNAEAGSTAASRVTYAVGRAVVAAAQDMAAQVRSAAAPVLGLPPADVELGSGWVRNPLSGQRLALADLVRQTGPLRAAARLRVPLSETPASAAVGHPHVLVSSNVQIAQVAVDSETGQARVERVVAFPEAGRVINRAGLEGQCEGGVAQGVGYALLEEVQMRDGRVLNADLATYPTPTAADVPVVETVPVEVPEASGPFGAKGAGENATLPTAPAVLSALEDAIGVRFVTLPVTPERIIEALDSYVAPASDTEGGS